MLLLISFNKLAAWSSAGCQHADLKVNWAGLDVEAWQEILQTAGGTAVQAVLHKQGLPKRLAEALCQELDIVGTPVAQLKKVCSLDVRTKNIQLFGIF